MHGSERGSSRCGDEKIGKQDGTLYPHRLPTASDGPKCYTRWRCGRISFPFATSITAPWSLLLLPIAPTTPSNSSAAPTSSVIAVLVSASATPRPSVECRLSSPRASQFAIAMAVQCSSSASIANAIMSRMPVPNRIAQNAWCVRRNGIEMWKQEMWNSLSAPRRFYFCNLTSAIRRLTSFPTSAI